MLLEVVDVLLPFKRVFLRPGSTVHCIYDFSSPENPGQNPGQNSGQKPAQKSGQKSEEFPRQFLYILCFALRK